jgi:hypothetical protein
LSGISITPLLVAVFLMRLIRYSLVTLYGSHKLG